jgi:hypothetical protein
LTWGTCSASKLAVATERTQHDQVVEVVHDLASLGLVAHLGLDVEHRLGVGSDLEARAAQLVDHGHELGPAISLTSSKWQQTLGS